MEEIIFFVLFTGRTSEILQIAAVCGDQQFNQYIKPTIPIDVRATKVHKLTFVGGTLKHQGNPVDAVTAPEGLRKFSDFVNSFNKPILIGHNIQVYDLPILMTQMSIHNVLDEFKPKVGGFIDTLKLAKKIWDKETCGGNHKQGTLVKTFLGIAYEAHNALADVTSLQQLYLRKMKPSCCSDDLFNFDYYSCKLSLEPLVSQKVISAQTAQKLTLTSLNLSKLKLIHSRDQYNGIRNVFSEPLPGSNKPRISENKNLINKLVEYLNTC